MCIFVRACVIVFCIRETMKRGKGLFEALDLAKDIGD